MPVHLRIVQTRSPGGRAAVRRLFREYAESLPFSLDFQGFAAELAALPEPYVSPSGCLLLAKREEASVGVVALKPLAPGIAERGSTWYRSRADLGSVECSPSERIAEARAQGSSARPA